jgi:hypothetical protein
MLKQFVALTVLSCMLLVTGAHSTEVQPTEPVTDLERQALVVGMVLGLDLALANQGLPPMSKESWVRFANIFDQATAQCHDIQCITESMVKLRNSVMEKTVPQGAPRQRSAPLPGTDGEVRM